MLKKDWVPNPITDPKSDISEMSFNRMPPVGPMAPYVGLKLQKKHPPQKQRKKNIFFFFETKKLRPGENLYAILGSKRKNAAAFADLMRNEGM